MKVLVIVKASKDSEAGKMPSSELISAMGKFNEELIKAGLFEMGAGLTASSHGARVKFAGSERTVIDGPFPETKELIAGFWIWNVKSMAEAIDWVRRCPNPHLDEGIVELRPFMGPECFGDSLTGEVAEQDAAVRALALGLGEIRYDTGRPMVMTGLAGSFTVQTAAKIPDLWMQFAPHIAKIPGVAHADVCYGVSFNQTREGSFDYLCGQEIAESAATPTNFTRLNIPGGRYVVVTHQGHISKLPETVGKMWREWLPETALKPAQSPWYERYDERWIPATGEGPVELWLPLAS